MGLLLLTLSIYSLRQLISHMNPALITVHTYSFDPFAELLLCPFLFLYIVSLIRPQPKYKIRFHLLVMMINLLLFFLSGYSHRLLKDVMLALVFVINCHYFHQTLCLLFRLVKGPVTAWRDSLFPHYSLIAVISILIFINIILAALCPMICTGLYLYIVQMPKGILVFYLYYLILQTSDFSMGTGEPEK